MTRRYQGALAVCVLLIGYVSLYPLVPLRAPADGAIVGFFTKPRFIPGFDLALNVLAYVPFGLLAGFRFREVRSARPIFRAVSLAAAMSFGFEACQLFIPHRVASIIDVLANAIGAGIGALAFVEPIHAVLTRPLGDMRERLFASGLWGDAGVILLALWLLAQLNPALPFFGAGNIVAEGAHTYDAELLLVITVGLSSCGFALFVSTLMRATEGSLRATIVLLSVALWLKFAAGSVMLKPHFSAEWVSWGRVVGLIAGMVFFVPFRKLGRAARIYVAIVLMLAGTLFSKIFGSYDAIEEVLRFFNWPHGQLAGFATLTGYMHELWPFAALVFLIGYFFHARKISTLLERTQTLESRNFQ
jgi:VanZ family protein